MAYAYGTTLGSTIRMYVKYDVVNTDLTYTITIQEIGLYSYSDTYVFDGCNKDSPISITAFGITKSNVISRNIGLAYKKTYLTAESFTSFSNTYPKKNEPQTVAITGSMRMSTWMRAKGNTGSEMSAGTSTISFDITVPAIERPTISITGTRDSQVQTTVGFDVTVNSFATDVISSISIVDGNGRRLGSTATPIRIGASGQIVQPFVVQGVTTGSIVAKAVAIGLGGESAEESVVIPVAFFTMDVQKGGKEIAFGSSAIDSTARGSEHGKFNCFMDADFKNGLSTGGHDSPIGTRLSGSIADTQATSTTTTKHTITLSEGVWILTVNICFGNTTTTTGSTSTAAGTRAVILSTSDASYTGAQVASSTYAEAGKSVRVQVTSHVVAESGGKTMNVRLYSTSNCATTLGYWFATRIA